MIKVNLISKKRKAYRGRNWTRLISYILFGVLTTYFVGATLYVLISTLVLNGEIAQVQKETVSVSGSMLQNNDKLSRFVLTKLILTQIESLNSAKFNYKAYLDEVNTFLPSGVSLISVDFATKGWLTTAVSAANMAAFQSLEKTLLDTNTWNGNKFFSSVYIESVSRNSDGSYVLSLHFQLKKIDGTK